MGIFSRLAGGALLGPIGLLGPTEASKRSNKQLAEMKKQTGLIESQNKFLGVTPEPKKAGWEGWSGAQQAWAVVGVVIVVLAFFFWPLMLGAHTDAQGAQHYSTVGILAEIVWLPIAIWLLRRFYRNRYASATPSGPSTPLAVTNVGEEAVTETEVAGLVPPPRPSFDTSGDGLVERLERLSALKAAGELTQTEYDAAKTQLLHPS
jgi:hypothetical protein